MKREFDEQCNSLFAKLEDRVRSAPWFEADQMSIARGNFYLDVLVKNKAGGKVCDLYLYMGPRELSESYAPEGRSFTSQLMFPADLKDTDSARKRFKEKAKVALAKKYSSS